jgi:hypothetical protein
MIPMEMSQEKLDVDGIARSFLHEQLPQIPNTAAGVQNDGFIGGGTHFHAGGVAAESKIFNLWGGSGTSDTPES